MNGFSGFGNSPAKELKDLRGTKEKGKKVDLTVKPNPTTKAVKNKDYKIDEKEEQTIENMSNAKDNNFDGQTEMKINKLKNKKPKKKALELKQGEHNSKEYQAKVEKDIELRDEGKTLPPYTRRKR